MTTGHGIKSFQTDYAKTKPTKGTAISVGINIYTDMFSQNIISMKPITIISNNSIDLAVTSNNEIVIANPNLGIDEYIYTP